MFCGRELLSTSQSVVPIAADDWTALEAALPSEVQVLLTEDLQEEESGEDDEYIPHREEVSPTNSFPCKGSICYSN